MFERAQVNFPPKAILTAAMLQELRDYPDDYFRLSLKNHSDGIIAGLEYEQVEDSVYLGSGIMKCGGELYFFKEKTNISKLLSSPVPGKTYHIYLDAIEDKNRQSCINYKIMQPRISDAPENGLSLGEIFIHGEKTFTLPQLDLNDSEPFGQFLSNSKFNLLNVCYAAIGEPTFHPVFFTAVKQFLYKKKQKTMMDYAIMVHLQSSPVLDTETMKFYIAEASGNDVECDKTGDTVVANYSRRQLFEKFVYWLKESRQEISVKLAPSGDNEKAQERKSKNSGKLI